MQQGRCEQRDIKCRYCPSHESTLFLICICISLLSDTRSTYFYTKIPDLKAELKKRRYPVSGKKAELADRLVDYYELHFQVALSFHFLTKIDCCTFCWRGKKGCRGVFWNEADFASYYFLNSPNPNPQGIHRRKVYSVLFIFGLWIVRIQNFLLDFQAVLWRQLKMRRKKERICHCQMWRKILQKKWKLQKCKSRNLAQRWWLALCSDCL